MSVGSPVGGAKLQSILKKNGATYLEQINHVFDLVTYPRKVILFVIGFFSISVGIGIWTGQEVATRMGGRTGSIDMLAAGWLGGHIAAVLSCIAGLLLNFYSIKNFHSFHQYFQNRQLQQQVLNWQKQQQPANPKK